MNENLISIVVPVRNEEKYIINCLNSILSFNIPKDFDYEIMVVDGNSDDNTLELVKNFISDNEKNNIKIIKNQKLTQAHGLNIAINNAIGSRILRLDAHCIYSKNYLYDLIETSKRKNVENIGGIVITKRGGSNYSAGLVQALTTHKFGVGDSSFRTEAIESESDTVPFGFFKKSIFDQIGYFDERLVRAQDYEFNRRIIKCGGKIWLNPNITATYFNQPSIASFLKKQLFKEAPYNAYMWYLAPYTFAYRHAITGVFTTGVIGGILLAPFTLFIKYTFFSVMVIYFVLAVVSAIQQAKRYKKMLHVLTLPISFFLYHFLHGLGVLGGLMRLAIGKSPVQKIKEPWNGYGKFRIDLDNVKF